VEIADADGVLVVCSAKLGVCCLVQTLLMVLCSDVHWSQFGLSGGADAAKLTSQSSWLHGLERGTTGGMSTCWLEYLGASSSSSTTLLCVPAFSCSDDWQLNLASWLTMALHEILDFRHDRVLA